MQKIQILFIAFLLSLCTSLTLVGEEKIQFSQTPYKNIRLIEDSVFFTSKNQRSFGYLNAAEKGKVDIIYLLNQDQNIVDQLQNTEHIVIANKNKSLTFFDPHKRELTYDDRFVNENFSAIISYKKVGNKQFVLVQDAVRLYQANAEGSLVYREILSTKNLNAGIVQNFLTLFAFPIPSEPNRIVTLTWASVDKNGQEKLVICFKWFKESQNFKMDGICHYDTNIKIKSVDTTDDWLYLRNAEQTYVFDKDMRMVTKWPQIAQQFHGGQAILESQMTYLFKSNQIAYFRTINNFENNLNYKMSVNPQSLVVFRKEKRMVKITKSQDLNPIGVWVKQMKQNTFKLLIQFDNMHLHYYKIVKTPASTQINYLFRIHPKVEQIPVQQEQNLDQEVKKDQGKTTQQSKVQETVTGQSTEEKEQKNDEKTTQQEILAIAPVEDTQQTEQIEKQNTQL